MAHIQSNGTGGGNWSSTGTWSGGVVPGDGDTAEIVAGDTVTVDSNTTVGATTGTQHGVTIKGTSSSVYGQLNVNASVTLTLKGVSTTYHAMYIERYGLFQPSAGATIHVDNASDYVTGIKAKGIVNAIGTSGSRIAFAVPSGNVNWGASVTGESVSGTGYHDPILKVQALALANPWISNAAGTGLGSYGDTSVSISNPSPAGLCTTEVANKADVNASGEYWVDYDMGVIYFYNSAYSSASFDADYEYLSTASWKGWYIDATDNQTYNEAKFEYCDFSYMGGSGAYNEPVLDIRYKQSAAVASNRLFKLDNCSMQYNYNGIYLRDCTGTAGDPVLITNNAFNTHKGNDAYKSYYIYCYTSTSTYIKVDSNTLNCVGQFISATAPYGSVQTMTGWTISNNTGRVGGWFIEIATNCPNTVWPSTTISGNTLTGCGDAVADPEMLGQVTGTAANPATITGNTFDKARIVGNIGSHTRWTKNCIRHFNHNGIIARGYGKLEDVEIVNNLFVGFGSGIPGVCLGHNFYTWVDDIQVVNNTFWYSGAAALALGDPQVGIVSLITRAVFANNIIQDWNYGIGYEPETASRRTAAGLIENDYNLTYSLDTAIGDNVNGFATFMMGGSKYNTHGTRNIDGVSLWDPSYATPPAAKNLVLTVTAAGSNETIAWGGGTAQQLVMDTGTATSAANAGSGSAHYYGTLTDSGKSWSTSLNNSNCPSAKWVKITGGTGSGQIRGIIRNTATQLYTTPEWDTVPDGTSTYSVYEAEVTCYDSGASDYVKVGIYLPDLPTSSQTDSSITYVENSRTGDPSLTDATDVDAADAVVTSGGDGVDQGTADNAPADDYIGTSRTGSIDIGAYELLSGGSITNVPELMLIGM